MYIADCKLQITFTGLSSSQTEMEGFMKSRLTMDNNQPRGKEEHGSLSDSKQTNTN